MILTIAELGLPLPVDYQHLFVLRKSNRWPKFDAVRILPGMTVRFGEAEPDLGRRTRRSGVDAFRRRSGQRADR
jgi:hypothetical protein